MEFGGSSLARWCVTVTIDSASPFESSIGRSSAGVAFCNESGLASTRRLVWFSRCCRTELERRLVGDVAVIVVPMRVA